MIILLHLSVSFQTTWKALIAAPTSNVMRVPHVTLLGKLLGDFKKFLQESGILWLPCVLEVNMSSWATSFLAYIDARNLTNLQSVTKILQKIWNYKQPLKTALRTINVESETLKTDATLIGRRVRGSKANQHLN